MFPGTFRDTTNLDSRSINLINTTGSFLDQRARSLIRTLKKRTPLSPLSTFQKPILPDDIIEYPLLPSKRAIRLLDLQYSSVFNGAITTTLKTFNLDDAPPFRALSYTWGDPYQDLYTENVEVPSKPAATILCNGKKKLVTQNLLDALKSLTNLDINGLIWIDAICINQQDDSERASQIPLMGDIYSLASEVLVYLGHYKEASDDVLWATTDFLKSIADEQQPGKPKVTYSQDQLLDPKFWSSLEAEYPLKRLLRFAEFYHSCRWFTRVWTVQEVTLARHTRMFCGETELSLQSIQDLFSIMNTLGWTREILSLLKADVGATISLQRRFFVELTALRRLKDIVRQATNHDEDDRDRWKAGSEWCITLSKILFSCRSHFCLNPRDKVYASLAMINDTNSQGLIAKRITADYTIPFETVFTDVTALILEHSKFLDIISDTRHQDLQLGQGTGIHFPSWAHDFSVRFVASSLVSANPSFNAALSAASEFPPFVLNGLLIECHGAALDTITEVQARGLEQLVLREEHSTFEFFQLYLILKPHIQGATRLEVLWRSLTLGLPLRTKDHLLASSFVAWLQVSLAIMLYEARHNGEESFAEAASIINSMLSTGSPEEIALVKHMVDDDLASLIEPDYDPEDITAGEKIAGYDDRSDLFASEIPDALELRRLCTTSKGFLSVCVDTVQKNDQVWLLTDAHTPMILRPTDVPGSFRIVGDCYIHGFMHGEMLDEEWGVRQNIRPIKIV